MDNGMQGLSRLKGISITELVFGILTLLALFQQRGTSNIISHAITAALLFAAGILGVMTVNNARRNVLSMGRFRTVATLNTALGVLGVIDVIVCIVVIVIILSDRCNYDCASYLGVTTEDEYRGLKTMTMVVMIILCIFSVLFAAMAFSAASIARKNANFLAVNPHLLADQGFVVVQQGDYPVQYVKQPQYP